VGAGEGLRSSRFVEAADLSCAEVQNQGFKPIFSSYEIDKKQRQYLSSRASFYEVSRGPVTGRCMQG